MKPFFDPGVLVTHALNPCRYRQKRPNIVNFSEADHHIRHAPERPVLLHVKCKTVQKVDDYRMPERRCVTVSLIVETVIIIPVTGEHFVVAKDMVFGKPGVAIGRHVREADEADYRLTG